MELELDIEPLERLTIWLRHLELVEVKCDREVVPNGDKLFGKPSIFFVLDERFAWTLLGQLAGMSQDVLEMSVLLYQLTRSLVTNSFNSRNII
jgi:hypothetical protein